MNIIKAKIIIICGILVLSILAGLIIKISSRGLQNKSEQTSAPAKSSEETSTLKNPVLKFPIADETLKDLTIPKLPIPKPDLNNIAKEKSLPSAAVPFFENINNAAKAVEKSLMASNAPVQSISTTTSNGIILSLTQDQFRFLYPDEFIASLVNAQNSFVKEINPDYEPILKIETDAQVRSIEEKIVATLLSENMITKESAEQFVTTIRFTLPQLQLIDLEKYNSYGFYKTSPISKFIDSALGENPPLSAPKKVFLADLMDKLSDVLAHKAEAVCGSCSPRPECFQEGTSIPGKIGLELFYPSCYCTGCLTSLGCLSANNGQAAIYDQMTGICGTGSASGSISTGANSDSKADAAMGGTVAPAPK